MSDLLNYDIAIAQYLKKHKTRNLPLMSWDIYASFAVDIRKSADDQKFLAALASEHNWSFDPGLITNVPADTVVVVTDPQINIVFSSENIVYMTGYRSSEVIGKSPRMFQGELTDKADTAKIRKSILEKTAFEETIINYRKDGSTYPCSISGFPVFNKKGRLVHFIAFEKAA